MQASLSQLQKKIWPKKKKKRKEILQQILCVEQKGKSKKNLTFTRYLTTIASTVNNNLLCSCTEWSVTAKDDVVA